MHTPLPIKTLRAKTARLKPLRLTTLGVLVAAGALALTACGSNAEAPEQPVPGFRGVSPNATWSADESWAARIDGDYQVLFITTKGSSSCPWVVDEVTHDEDAHHLAVAAHQHIPASKKCTMDLQPHTSFVNLPEPLEPGVEVTIELEGFDGEITLTADTQQPG